MERRAQFKIILTTIAVLAGLAVVELALSGLPIAIHYRVLVPNRRATTYPQPPHIVGISGPSQYSTNEIGMRARPWPPERRAVYRILAVGGSTTQDVYLDDAEAWTAVLERELAVTPGAADVWIGNVGKSGLSARDHAVQVPRLLSQHPQIDAILVLAGANDLLTTLSQGDTYRQPPSIGEPSAQQKQTLRAFDVVPRRLVDQKDLAGLAWYRRTGIWQGLRLARANLMARRKASPRTQDSTGAIYSTWRKYRRDAPQLIEQVSNLDAALEEYERNLTSIIQSAAAGKTRLVLLTQPMIWRPRMSPEEEQRLWLGGVGDFMSGPGHSYYTPAALAEGMQRFNERLMAICARHRVECFDLAAQVPRDTLLYYDDAHYTEEGARAVARAVATYLKGSAPFASR
jgi:lysophospholipase L1-like esterase